MILDKTLIFGEKQAITVDAGSTNVIDIGAAGTAYGHAAAVRRDIGIATEIPIFLMVTEVFNNLTSLTVSLQVDDDEAFGSPTTIATSAPILLASLVAGYKFTWPAELPEGTAERYIRVYYDVTGTAPTTGKITAAIVAGRQTN